MLIRLARRSLWNRRITLLLTLISLTVSIALVLGIHHIKNQARSSFGQTLSGTDLIVGARSGQLNLLLYSVFRIGNATSNMTWQSYEELARHRSVAWTVPLSLGDSHKGYRVLGTLPVYFEHYRFGGNRLLEFSQGKAFDDLYDAVLGAEVARQLGYQLDDALMLAHGTGAVNLHHHSDQPFRVSGILKATGTPVDRTIHISLAGMEAIHVNWQQGMPMPGKNLSAEKIRQMELVPKSITATLVGLNTKAATFTLQRQINQYRQEPLLAILPGVALSELWQMLGTVEQLLWLISLMVLVAALIGMTTSLLASMNERQREIAILRATGAGARHIFLLIELEVLLITLVSMVASIIFLTVGLFLAQPLLAAKAGLFIAINPLQKETLGLLACIPAIALVLGLIPASLAYRRALHEGLSQRL